MRLETVAVGFLLAIGAAPVVADMESFERGDESSIESVIVSEPEWAEGELLVKFRSVTIPDEFPRTGQTEALRSLMPESEKQVLDRNRLAPPAEIDRESAPLRDRQVARQSSSDVRG